MSRDSERFVVGRSLRRPTTFAQPVLVQGRIEAEIKAQDARVVGLEQRVGESAKSCAADDARVPRLSIAVGRTLLRIC